MSPQSTPTAPIRQQGATSASSSCQDCPGFDVTLFLIGSEDVACPGHPYDLYAEGTPTSGSYVWSVIGGDALLQSKNGIPDLNGGVGTCNQLISFKADDVNGNIPPKEAKVTVKYTYEGVTVTSDPLTIPIHGINFNVTGDAVDTGDIVSMEDKKRPGVMILGSVGKNAVFCGPKVQIRLGAGCPRKKDCAQNYQVGWLQTITANHREMVYDQHKVFSEFSIPIRDGDSGIPPITPTNPPRAEVPFYRTPYTFTDDMDSTVAEHKDAPTLEGDFTLTYTMKNGQSAREKLQGILFSNSFNAWLVVENMPQFKRQPDESAFVYLRHFSWSLDVDCTVDPNNQTPTGIKPLSTPVVKVPSPKPVALPGKGSDHPNMLPPLPGDPGVQKCRSDPPDIVFI